MLPLCLGIFLTVLDQLTKSWVRQHFDLYESVAVIPGFFDLRYIQNSGAAWGIFSGGHDWLAVLSVVVLGAMVTFRRSFFGEGIADCVAFGFLIGGITGNLIDRLRLQYVVDFLDFSWRGRHFPAFNVADSAICIGVGIMLFSQFLLARREYEARQSAGDVS